jgi:outer membrane protein TolC
MIANNPSLQALEKQYLSSLERVPQVGQLPDPELGIGAFPLPVETRLGAQVIRIGATQMLPWKGILNSKENLALAKAEVIHENTEAELFNLLFELRQAYFEHYYLKEQQTVLSRKRILLEALEQLALAKVSSGKASAADVIRVQLKLEALEQELIILERSKAKPTIRINQLLNRDLNTLVSSVDTLGFAEMPVDRIALEERIRNEHPILRRYTLEQEVSRQAIALNDLQRKPTFGVGFDYIAVNKRSDADPAHNGRDILQLRASVRIPLYKEQYTAKANEEKLRIESIEDQRIAMLQQFLALIAEAYVDHEIARERLELYQQQIDLTKSAINILESTYAAEGRQFDELLRLEEELIDYQLNILKSVVQSHLAKSRVERFVGF